MVSPAPSHFSLPFLPRLVVHPPETAFSHRMLSSVDSAMGRNGPGVGKRAPVPAVKFALGVCPPPLPRRCNRSPSRWDPVPPPSFLNASSSGWSFFLFLCATPLPNSEGRRLPGQLPLPLSEERTSFETISRVRNSLLRCAEADPPYR